MLTKTIPGEKVPLIGNSLYEVLLINEPEEKETYTVLTKEDLEYYTARPSWMRLRLCLFWTFWAALLVMLVISILINWCVLPSVCQRV